ncbi:MAG TPA: ribosome silencing factor [Clostridia bacterium]|jgi:ribosome-associated protein|nr:ribosome silencing factor [Clostridia bacterium]
MDIKQIKDLVVKCLDEKAATDIQVLDISEKSSIGDFFIIATGKNLPQVRALSDYVEKKLEENEVFVSRKEGYTDGRWIVLDYGDVIVHLFNSETRDFYCLEQLWR